MNPGASLRDRATLPSPLKRSRPFGRVSLAPPFALLTARSACPAVRSAHRRCRSDASAAKFDGNGVFAAVHSSRRRYAPRSSATMPRSPWPATPAAGSASARRPGAPCVAGDGFAVHRAPHYAMHRWQHQCGQLRHRLRQRAAHDCPRLRPHRPPLIRRRGSIPPGPPAPIPRTLMPQLRPSRPHGGGLGSHTGTQRAARRGIRAHTLPSPAYSTTYVLRRVADRAYALRLPEIVVLPRGPGGACPSKAPIGGAWLQIV